ncbi:MAG: acetyl-CoA acetyltransferase [Hydrogenophaga sp.]|uniref:acetyl-CoA acetyltransferase n=1 Tax=Hydrogenophaga sp. TaxID=1904254 RepID=UPI003D0EA41F
MTNHAYITGWGHTPFGKLDNCDLEQLIRDAVQPALQSAGLEPRDIDGIFVGHFNAGFVGQDFTAALPAVAMPEFRHTPSMRTENACATGSAAIWAALDAMAAGRMKRTLVIGMEKMNGLKTPEVAATLIKCSYVREEGTDPAGFAGIFGGIATRYFERYGDQSDALAAIAAKNHSNGMHNPYAHMRRDFGFDFCRTPSEKNPFVSGPLKRSDCSLVSDGAAALVLSTEPLPGASVAPVRWRSRTQVNDYLPMSRRDPTKFEGAAMAWQRGLADAGASLGDLSFVETHDCFTIAELLEYEAMGLAPHGQGARVILDGVTRKDGRLPVNPSGGLKSKGHPIGATGVSQHVMAAMQLSGTAGGMQLPGAGVGAVFNMGGSGVASYLSLLQAA